MKKIWMLLMAMIMVFTVSTTVQAANTKLSVSDASSERTKIVYLTVSLSNCKKANTLGISMKYDSTVLKKVASDCKWEQKGVLQDFDVAKDNGVWASKKAQDVNGTICTLAFRVKADAPIGKTKVTCEVVVKNGSKVIGTYTAKGTVSVTCKHSYGEWTANDIDTHKKICKYCEFEKTASHKWDAGVVTKQPTEQEEGIRVYKCETCGQSKEEKIAKIGTDTSDKQNDSKLPESDHSSHKNETTIKPNNSNSVGVNNSVPDDLREDVEGDVEEPSGTAGDITETDTDTDTEEQKHSNESETTTNENNQGKYLWMLISFVALGILVVVFIKIKTKNK